MSNSVQSLGFSLPGKVADLERRAQAQLSLTERVRSCLPTDHQIHLLSASYKEDTLSVTMDSAVWCPQVRFAAETLLARIRGEGGPDVAKLKVRVGRREA